MVDLQIINLKVMYWMTFAVQRFDTKSEILLLPISSKKKLMLQPKPRLSRRTVTIAATALKQDNDQSSLSFRVASSKKIEVDQSGMYVINERLRVRIDASRLVRIVDKENGGQRLEIPIEVDPEKEVQIVIDYLWD